MITRLRIRAILRARRMLPVIVPALSVGVALSMALALEPSSSAPVVATPPVSHPAPPTAASGRALFVQSCAHCHGDDATGSGEDGDGPDLHSLAISNGRIATVIHHGIRGEMPSFIKKFSEAETTALIDYLRSLH